MTKLYELLKRSRDEELWQLCCGFLDLNISQFMTIQKSLLLEQINLLGSCALGKRLFRGAHPLTVEDFRRDIPLTTYIDYCPDLLERREDVLPAKPVEWIQTLGNGGEYPYKWVPVTERYWEEAGLNFGAVALLGSCSRKGEVAIRDKMKILYAASGSPYLTNAIAHRLIHDIDCRFLPDISEAEHARFEDLVEKGFKMALNEGMDGFYGLGATLVAIGMKFKNSSGNTSKFAMVKQPGALLRLAGGLLKSKWAGRHIMPKDLWKLKYIMTMGTDSQVYKNKIKELWGRTPLDVFGNTETTVVATQTWDYKDMVFFPNLNFLEFIPEEECYESRSKSRYHLKTLLLDEVEPGKTYELVVTNLHGGALCRYRTGNLIRITALRNEKLGIELPQMMYEGRADDQIDLGFIRLNERVIWQALENSGVGYKEWIACKEIEDTPKLHLYVEPSGDKQHTPDEISDLFYRSIKDLDGGSYVYGQISSIESLIDCRWIKVTLLPRGVFSGYKRIRQEQKAALTQLKPPHLNPSEKDMALLGIKGGSVIERREKTPV
jgi:hypothetical protein